MISKDSIETAYCFFHQKERVYAYSTLDWQRDDIEYAIAQYVESMDPALYRRLSHDRPDFLLNHARFGAELQQAVAELEQML